MPAQTAHALQRRWSRGMLVALAVLAALPAATVATGGTCTPTVDASCLSRIAIAQQGRTSVLTAALLNSITGNVLACAGAGNETSATRPLRMVMASEVNVTVTKVMPAIRALTGWEVTMSFMPYATLGQGIIDSVTTLGKGYYDAYGGDSTYTVDLMRAGMLEVQDSYVLADSKIEWADILSFLRSSSSLYNGSIVGLPMTSYFSHLLWRRDVLARAGLQPPNTWQELIEVAKALNGTDMDGDGEGDFATCINLNPLLQSGSTLSQVLASMTQSQGTSTGWLFDPNNMQSFVDTPAFTHALDLLRQLAPYNLETVSYEESAIATSNPFVLRKCALHAALMVVFKAAQLNSRLGGLVGTSQVPGSTVVLDRSTGQLTPCTPSLCPYATWVNGVGVNRAAYTAITTGLGMINPNVASTFRAAAYAMESLFTQFTYSMPNVLAAGFIGPFRYRHLCVTPSCLASWEAAGYNRTDVSEYLNATRVVADDPNAALDLRIPQGVRYREALNKAVVMLRNGTSIPRIQAVISQTIASIMAETPLQDLGDAYLAGLNLRRRFVPPSPPPPPPNPAYSSAAPPGAAASAGSGSGLSTGAEAGIIVAACVGAALLAAGAAYATVAWRMKRRRQGVLGPAKAPGAGPGTTLVVTDIEGSTTLWETLPQEVMNEALDLHHKLVRKLLHQHAGHEADTEGDSFIIAFSTPWDALTFGQALQKALLHLEWPTELLQCSLASPVWAQDMEDQEAAELWGRPHGESVHLASGAGHGNSLDLVSPIFSTTAERKAGRQSLRGREGSITFRSAVSFLTEASPFAARNGPRKPQRVSSQADFSSPGARDGHSMVKKSVATVLPHFAKTEPSRSVGLERSGSGTGPNSAVSTGGGPSDVREVHIAVPLDAPSSPPAASEPLPKVAESGKTVNQGAVHALTTALSRISRTRLSEVPHSAPLHGRATGDTHTANWQTQAVLEVLWRGWEECGAPDQDTLSVSGTKKQCLVLRGLRVRVGLHSGLSEEDVVEDPEKKARTKYVGRALSMAKAVCDCGHGGMVLLSEACYGALVPASGLAAFGHMLHLGDYEFVTPGAPVGPVYWAVAPELQPRVPLLMRQPLRSSTQRDVGALDAPAGHAAVVFVNVVGAAALSAWDAAVAGRAFAQLHEQARRLLSQPCGLPDGEVNGYAVKTSEGMCLCSFACPRSAVLWALHLVNELKVSVEWEPALLQHELCEEVVMDVVEFTRMPANRPGSGRTSRATSRVSVPRVQWQGSALTPILAEGVEGLEANGGPPAPTIAAHYARTSSTGIPEGQCLVSEAADHVLFRGLRLKIGLDAGAVQATIVPGTGRVDYRGRILNRAARVAAKAQAGQVWASKVAWELAHETDVEGLLEPRPLGPVALKGVAEPVELVQCKLR